MPDFDDKAEAREVGIIFIPDPINSNELLVLCNGVDLTFSWVITWVELIDQASFFVKKHHSANEGMIVRINLNAPNRFFCIKIDDLRTALIFSFCIKKWGLLVSRQCALNGRDYYISFRKC